MLRRTLFAALLFVLTVAALVPSAAQQKPLDAAPAEAALVVSVDVKKLWAEPSFAAVKEARGRVEFGWLLNALIGFTPDQLDRVTLFWTGGSQPTGPYILAETREAHDAAKVLGELPRAGKATGVKALTDNLFSVPRAEFPAAMKLTDRALLLSPKNDAKAVAALAKEVRREATGPAVVVRANAEALAAVPAFNGAKSLTFTIAPSKDAKAAARLTLAFADAAGAKGGVKALDAAFADLGKWTTAQQKAVADKPYQLGTPGPLLEVIAAALKGARVKADGSTVAAATEFDLGEAVRGFVTAVPDAAFAAKGNSPGENNLKQIGIAQHSYHDALSKFPGNSYSKDGKPLLSWRVHILPYIEQDALYRQFKLDEPWDSEHNIKLSKVLVRTYTIPNRPAPLGETYFRSFMATKTALAPYRPLLLDGANGGPTFARISDGLSNTIMVVEAGESVVWTKPEGLPYDGVIPVPQLGGPSGQFLVGFCDGSVRTLRRQQVSDANLRGMITIAGGEIVNIP